MTKVKELELDLISADLVTDKSQKKKVSFLKEFHSLVFIIVGLIFALFLIISNSFHNEPFYVHFF